MDRHLAENPDWRSRLDAANERYATERDALVPADADLRPGGGVAGTTGEGVKCLHAHYADHATGHDNPIGEWTAPFVEPLNCESPCVAVSDGDVERNPDWVEPR